MHLQQLSVASYHQMQTPGGFFFSYTPLTDLDQEATINHIGTEVSLQEQTVRLGCQWQNLSHQPLVT